MTISKFVWYDLMTADTKAATAFYGNLVGWEAKDSGMTDRSYTILSKGPSMVGGIMEIPKRDGGAGPGAVWSGYIGVDDVDVFTSRVKDAGGKVHLEPTDIPGVGRFSVVVDPYGAAFVLFRGLGDAQAPAHAGNEPGRIGWHELHSSDGEAAFRFYSSLFGWTKAETIDMGPMGIYQTFATGGAPVGGIMTKTPQMPAPLWLYYFNVDAIDAAAERVRKNGGKVILDPHEVPGGTWILQGIDPEGAMFALAALKR